MHRVKRSHPALKHGAYSVTGVLPGESQADFEKLHRDLISDHAPAGVHEKYIVLKMAHLIWRDKNLGTLRIVPHVMKRYSAIFQEKLSTIKEKPPESPFDLLAEYRPKPESEEYRQAVADSRRAAEEQARKELGDEYELIKIGEAATFDGLIKELEIRERLEAAIARCVKQLLLVRGVKSISVAASPKHLSGPPKAA